MISLLMFLATIGAQIESKDSIERAGYLSSALLLCGQLEHDLTSDKLQSMNNSFSRLYDKYTDNEVSRNHFLKGDSIFLEQLSQPTNFIFAEPQDALKAILTKKQCLLLNKEAIDVLKK
ncbi:hypothetical protein KO527_25280 [Pseudoalteromonas sp. C2R02]|uniref:hypothetical protein n=1 Tax=Pseudoalteromonas sp. C2R02 TaxID=2841565 RepID=UPI001C08C297|nr:hypothetical protein [Pseudoalteromonas sp. C2R02]MBU2972654.1 hypothetical protein [Pseudoalteromonas sp. C2R02]